MVSPELETDIPDEVTALVLGTVPCAESIHDEFMEVSGVCWHNMDPIGKHRY